MPRPLTDESREDYLSRCMADPEAIEDYPEASQRYAVCVGMWEQKAEGHKPTEEMAAEARRGLEWRKEFNRGGTAIGVARARDISNRASLSMSTVKRMVSYFARHAVDKQGKGWHKGEEGYPSAGRIAWALWGGDAGRSWANKIAKASDEKSMNEIEHKSVGFELKEIDADGRIVGYGAVYGNVDRGGDMILPTAFDSYLAKRAAGGMPSLPMLWQHDPSQPIGVWDTLTSDSKGVLMQGRILAAVDKGREAIALTRAGAIKGLSIGYKTIEQDYQQTERGSIRQIKMADLWETSLVTFPMNPEAGLTDVKQLSSIRDVEQILCKAGVPNTFAKLVARHGFDEALNRLNGDPRDEDGTKSAGDIKSLLSSINEIKEALRA